MTARERVRRLVPAVLGAAGLVAATAGAVLLQQPPVLDVADVGGTAAAPDGSVAAAPAPAAPGPAAPAAATPAAPPAGVPAPPAPPPATAVAAPVHLAVPEADVAADVVPVGVEPSGALEVPPDPRVAGWWSSGAVPGATQGSTVLAAHVDAAGTGAGPMSRVLRVPPGTVVEVITADGSTLRFAVAERRSYDKSEGLPADLFRVDGPPRLVLVTCGGAFDAATGRYAENVVVVAVPV
ncbi:class F sortase [Cellulomonas endometrii]|uniref:class F sortase n=1 Tax=Cellulomonas endometrii TaxID=3036301 RepID=UPI0024ADEF34|nr:class F sortase [Cellulomonas endometrii]